MRHVSIWVAAFSLIGILSAKADIEVENTCNPKNVSIKVEDSRWFPPASCKTFSVAMKKGSQKIPIHTTQSACHFSVIAIWDEGEGSPPCSVNDGTKIKFSETHTLLGTFCDCSVVKK